MKPTPNHPARRHVAWFLALTACPAVLLAQTPSNRVAKAEETVELPAFEVSSTRGQGYAANSALSATKFAIATAELPLNVNVLTSDFIEDVNVSFPEEATLYSASNTSDDGRAHRGFSTSRKLKDGFRLGLTVPADVIERIEIFTGGPAVLYGRSTPGGLTNFIRKRPMFGQEFAAVKLGTGYSKNNYRRRAMIDVNGSRGMMAYRVVGSYGEYEDYEASLVDNGGRNGGGWPTKILLPSFTFQLTPKTRLTFMYEYYYRNFNGGFDESPFNRTIGDVPMSVLYPQIDQFTLLARGIDGEIEQDEYTVMLDHRVTENLELRAGFQYQDGDFYVGGNPAVRSRPRVVGGRLAVDQTFSKGWRNLKIPDLQLNGLYRKRLTNSDHRFLFGYQENQDRNKRMTWEARNPANPTQVFTRQFFPLETGIPANPPDPLYFVQTDGFRDRTNFVTYPLNYVGSYLGERLNVMAGASFTSIHFWQRDRNNVETELDVDGWNEQFGALYKLTPQWSLYTMYSEALEFSKRRDGFGRAFSPIVGESIEAGVKFSLLGGRLDGSFDAFRIVNQGDVVFDSLATNEDYERSVRAGTPNPSLLGAFTQSGENTAKGVELNFLYSHSPNWQTRVSYAWLDFYTSMDPVPARIGLNPEGYIENKFTVWTKYAFPSGNLKGLSVGGGLIWTDDEKGPVLSGVPTWEPERAVLDLFAAYKFNLMGAKTRLSLNAKNVTSEVGPRTSGYNAATRSRYTYKHPPVYLLDLQFEW